jgi:hypothetical protein
MAKMGRPSRYTKELADEICRAIATSSKGLKRMCEENEHWPDITTIFNWLWTNQGDGDFSQCYARAREQQCEYFADEIVDIADDGTHDYSVDEDGNRVVDHDHIQRSRLRVDTRKWILSKLKAKKYGEKIEQNLNGNLTLAESTQKVIDADNEYKKPY